MSVKLAATLARPALASARTTPMPHVVLLGDSVFDNARYVPDRPPVIEQLRRGLPRGWHATLLAVDGSVASDIPDQVARLPADATHLFVSAGCNDALGESTILSASAGDLGSALERLHAIAVPFRDVYRKMLRATLAAGKPVTVCTVYDAIPGLGAAERTALALFNDVILREAFVASVPVIDLRLVCDRPEDYSPLSPIEPSVVGGTKITRAIAEVATTHEFTRPGTRVYV
jgi:hypothetical protein